MIRLNDHSAAWDGPDREYAPSERQWAELVSEVCECFERGAFADATAAEAALESAALFSLAEPLDEDEISLCLRSRWPAANPAPVVFAARNGRPLRTEILERRDALSATPGLQLAGFAVVASRAAVLPLVTIAAERPACVAGQLVSDRRIKQSGSLRAVASSHQAGRISRARAALHDVALAEFMSAGELALTG